MRLTRIHQVAAKYDDLQQTKSFYKDILGAKFVEAFDPPGLLFFDFSGIRLLFERNNPSAVIYFAVDDIIRTHRELEGKGVVFESEPHLIHKDNDGTFDNVGTEEWMAFFEDPGGNTLALVERR